MKAGWAPAASAISVTKGRFELPRPRGPTFERRVSSSCTTWPYKQSDPCGNRTRPCSLRGCRPEPIDERAKMGREGIELSSSTPLVLRQRDYKPPWGTQPGAARGESRTRTVPGLSWAALPVGVPCRHLKASPTGFEPVISCVTGRRALQAAPRGQFHFSSSGETRTHSIPATTASRRCPSQGGLPLPTEPCSTQSEIRTRKRLGLSQAALPVGVPGQVVVPDGLEPSLVTL